MTNLMYAVYKANEENRLFRLQHFLNEAKRLDERAAYYKKEADRYRQMAGRLNPSLAVTRPAQNSEAK